MMSVVLTGWAVSIAFVAGLALGLFGVRSEPAPRRPRPVLRLIVGGRR